MKITKLILCIVLFLSIFGIPAMVVRAKSSDQIQEQNIKLKAQDFMNDLLNQNYDSCISKISPDLKNALGEPALKSYLVKLDFSKYKPELIAVNEEDSSNHVHDNVTLVYKANFTTVPVDINIKFNKNKLIDDFSSNSDVPKSSYQVPDYAKQDSFYEKDIILGQDKWKLPAVLSIPKGNGPFPAVVLVHGSGPNDKDETVYNTKVFKDLADGLASNGIAVLRYEKRTKEYPLMCSADSKFSINEETIDDAVEGVKLLKNTNDIDRNRVFVLGHSQGAMLAPSIVKNCGADKPAGAIMMAAPVNLGDTLLDQSKYLNSIGYMQDGQLDQVKSFCNILNDKDFPNNVTTSSSLLGGSSYYWLSMKNSTHVEDAQEINTPLLIMQGEKDYQVDISNLKHWQSILKNKNNVEYNSYPKLNHLFIEGKGLIGPNQYNAVENVPEYVIKDICNWIQKILERE